MYHQSINQIHGFLTLKGRYFYAMSAVFGFYVYLRGLLKKKCMHVGLQYVDVT